MLTKAFKSLDIHLTTATDAVETTPQSGASLWPAAAQPVAITKVVSSGTTAITGRSGSIELPAPTFEVKLTRFDVIWELQSDWLSGVKLCKLGLHFTVPYKFAIGPVKVSGKFAQDTQIFSRDFSLLTPVWLGPIGLTPSVKLTGGIAASGELSAEMSLPVPEVSGTLDGTYGFQWTPPNNWKPLEGDASTGPTATREAGGPYKAQLELHGRPLPARRRRGGRQAVRALEHSRRRLRLRPSRHAARSSRSRPLSIGTPPATAAPRGGERRSCRPAPASSWTAT